MSPRAQHILNEQNMTAEQFYLSCVNIPASTVINAVYPDIINEWRESGSNRLFSSWLSIEYAELVSFVRSLSAQEKINLMISIANEG